MSQYGREYRLEWLQASTLDVPGRTIRVSIYETSFIIDDADTPEVINLRPAGTPLTIDIIDNDRDKFKTIKAMQATIRFISKSNIGQDITTFCDRPDNEWLVFITDVDSGEFIFKGFLMLSDMTQLLLPDPNIVEMVASDHLGVLRDKPLVDFDGNNPVGKYRIAELLAFCLNQTGLELPIRVINNLRAGGGLLQTDFHFDSANNYMIASNAVFSFFYPGQSVTIVGSVSNDGTFIVDSVIDDGVFAKVRFTTPITVDEFTGRIDVTDNISSGHIYDVVYLDAKTFEQEIGLSEDCYRVIEKILGFDCFLTQWHGQWWIVRVDEFDQFNTYVASFDADGTYVSIAQDSFTKSIGRTEDVKFANADNVMQPDRPHKEVELTFDFTSPLEVPCNIDFATGAVFNDSNPLDVVYDFDCWTLLEGVPGFYGTVDGTTAKIHRIFDANNYEKERYLVLTPRTTFEMSSINDATYVQSQAIPVDAQDKISTSIDYRLTNNTSGLANARLFRVVLHGNDGSWWILGEDTVGDGIPVWYDTAAWTTNSAKGNTTVDFDAVDWVAISWEVPPMPVSGDLYLWINQLNQNSAGYDDHNIQFANLRFTYIPYINGSYQRYSGQLNKVVRATDPDLYNAKIQDQVFISDSPKKIFKGGLFFLSNGNYYLTSVFYSAAQFDLAPCTDPSFLHKFGWFQVFAVWNQYRRNNRNYDSTILGLGEDWLTLFTKITLTDTNPNTNDRYFIMLSFGQDWKTQLFNGFLSEVFETVQGRLYSDTFTFKYISQ